MCRAGLELYWSEEGYPGSDNTWTYYYESVSGVAMKCECVAVPDIERSYDNPRVIRKGTEFNNNHIRYGYNTAHWSRVHADRDYRTDTYRCQSIQGFQNIVTRSTRDQGESGHYRPDRHMKG